MGGTEGEINSTLVVESAGDTLMTIMDLMKKENIKSLVVQAKEKKCSNPFFVVLLSSFP